MKARNLPYIALLLLITSCTKGNKPTPIVEMTPSEEQSSCIQVYDPVCGVDGKTYSNACIATTIEKVTIAYLGECTIIEDCSTTYEPVCSEDGVTHRNACLAKKSGASIAYEGVCR